ncbi:hypothetical protein [Nocardia arthritidis]|uniref:hypothetical protein n=1 Tax=Nocardia arthritidis TaxID=228602 RepID=UPI001FE0128D|nr:hypothetical protein [Nocardia arthritidis]
MSVQVLNAVARTLSLDAAEKAHLYRLADVPTVPSVDSGSALPEELQVILDHLEPLPGDVAVLVSRTKSVRNLAVGEVAGVVGRRIRLLRADVP